MVKLSASGRGPRKAGAKLQLFYLTAKLLGFFFFQKPLIHQNCLTSKHPQPGGLVVLTGLISCARWPEPSNPHPPRLWNFSKCRAKSIDLDKNACFFKYEEQLAKRKTLFMEMTGIARGPVHTFITPNGIAPGIHSSFVHSQLTTKHLFADI